MLSVWTGYEIGFNLPASILRGPSLRAWEVLYPRAADGRFDDGTGTGDSGGEFCAGEGDLGQRGCAGAEGEHVLHLR